MIRKRLWARNNPPSEKQKTRNLRHMNRRREMKREAGMIVNQANKSSINWFDEGPDLIWLVRVTAPFSYSLSKNHIYTKRRNGHVALRREAKAKRRELSMLIRNALRNQPVVHNKVWLDILVQKPDHRGDAVNVIDLVCDAVKEAIPVDDRWYSIRRLDWEIVKKNPNLYIGIGQDSDQDCQICSYCGQIKPLCNFNKRKQSPLGVGRECKQCRAEGRKLAKKNGAA